MGEMADLMLEGACCPSCGEFSGDDGDGFPVYCINCADEQE